MSATETQPLTRSAKVVALEDIGGALADASFLARRYARTLSSEQKAEVERLIATVRDMEQCVLLWAAEAGR